MLKTYDLVSSYACKLSAKNQADFSSKISIIVLWSSVIGSLFHHKLTLDRSTYSRECLILGVHCVKSVQIRSYFWSVFSCIRIEYGPYLSVFSPNTGKYGPEITPHLDTFPAVVLIPKLTKDNNDFFKKQQGFWKNDSKKKRYV